MSDKTEYAPAEIQELIKDAQRWRKLVKLVGTPANGSDTTVSLFFDDATMTAWIKIGGNLIRWRLFWINQPGYRFDRRDGGLKIVRQNSRLSSVRISRMG